MKAYYEDNERDVSCPFAESPLPVRCCGASLLQEAESLIVLEGG